MSDRDVRIRIPFTTMIGIALFALLVVCLIKLWPVILMLFVAVLLAAMLDPIVEWLVRHRIRRGWGIAAVSLLMVGLLVFFFAVIVPSTASELRELSKDLPRIRADLEQRLPPLRQVIESQGKTPVQSWIDRGLTAGKLAVEGLTALLFVLVVTIYLLIEGQQTFEWLISFAAEPNRSKLRRTAREASGVAGAYVRGNVITSFICAGWALTTLLVLHVPAAIPLAVIAFVADFVPVVGTVVQLVPAVLLALTVSPTAALLVCASYGFYHLLENYVIIPRVYGKAMRLSTLTVLLSVTVGGILQGALGAVLILPVVAAYPIIERIWLRDELPADTVARHEAIEEGA